MHLQSGSQAKYKTLKPAHRNSVLLTSLYFPNFLQYSKTALLVTVSKCWKTQTCDWYITQHSNKNYVVLIILTHASVLDIFSPRSMLFLWFFSLSIFFHEVCNVQVRLVVLGLLCHSLPVCQNDLAGSFSPHVVRLYHVISSTFLKIKS